MKRKTAVKVMMSRGFDRNAAKMAFELIHGKKLKHEPNYVIAAQTIAMMTPDPVERVYFLSCGCRIVIHGKVDGFHTAWLRIKGAEEV